MQEPSEEALAAILADVRRGYTVTAIRTYRRATGANLVDAKRYVDDLARTERAPAQQAGRLRVLQVALVVLVVAVVVRAVTHMLPHGMP